MSQALLILIVPISWFFIAKYLLRHTFNFKELGLSIAIVSILVIVTIQLGKYGQTIDFEIWNGYVVSKERVHDTYEESYSCNCRETCSGSGKNRTCSETCDTCYRTHYTVDWNAVTTVGNITFDSEDSTWSSVYDTPDPKVYKRCKKGEPASIEHTYTNYVQAVPESLFNDDGHTVTEQFAGQIPAYPRVYSFYQINRVIPVGTKGIANIAKEIDAGLDEALKTLGAQKQANIIVILTGITDPTYRYAVEQAWLGGNKNDIVIFVGLDDQNIIWSDVMTWALNSGNELFHVTMRDGIMDMKTLDAKRFVPFVAQTVSKLYDRPQMASYEYLANEIDPPSWVIWLALFFAFGGSAGLTWFFHVKEI